MKKIEAYLGFCIRAGKITFGVDGISQLKKGVKLLLVDGALGESSLKEMKRSQEKFGCSLWTLKAGLLGELLHRPSVKAVAIKDGNLASAIEKEAEGKQEFTLNCGGHKEIYGKERL